MANLPTIRARIDAIVTDEMKAAYRDANEKYLFCDQALADADIEPNMSRIGYLEDRLEGVR